MPSSLHEALIQMFRHRPVLAVELLRDGLGVVVPDHEQARLESVEFTAVTPTEYRADAVVALTHAQKPVLAVVVEAQLRPDPAKRLSWPVYLTTLRARLKCPAVLLVVCTDRPAARWCATPIVLGHPGWILTPLVVGPDRVPWVVDADDAVRAPELAVLSAIAHGGSANGGAVLEALVGALDAVDDERAGLYADVVLFALPLAARRYLEALMTRTYEYQSDFARRYFAQGRTEGLQEGKAEGLQEGKAEGLQEGKAEGLQEGKAEGEAAALLRVLAVRGIEVPEDARARIAGCSDLAQLDAWINRAVTAEKIGDLFD